MTRTPLSNFSRQLQWRHQAGTVPRRPRPPPFANHQWNSASQRRHRAAPAPATPPRPRSRPSQDASLMTSATNPGASDPAFRSGLREARRCSDDANFRRPQGVGRREAWEKTSADRGSGDAHGVSHSWSAEPLRPAEVGTPLSRVSRGPPYVRGPPHPAPPRHGAVGLAP